MDSNYNRGLEVAIENLTTEFRGHRTETNDNFYEIRTDIKDIKSDVADLKTEVAVLKAQKEDATDKSRWSWQLVAIWAAVGAIVATLIETYYEVIHK